jgi:hypothetical protein
MKQNRLLIFFFLGLLWGIASSGLSFAAPSPDDDVDSVASLRCTVSNSEQQTPILTFDEESTSLNVELNDKKQTALVTVRGRVNQPEDTLLLNGQKIATDPKSDPPNEFQLPIRLTGRSTLLRLAVINPYGGIVRKNCIVLFPHYTVWENLRTKKFGVKPTNWALGLGVSFISYKETEISDLSETAITVKGGYSNGWNDKWSYAIGGYFTLLPISTSSPTQSIRFIGINGRIGYRIPWISAPWGLSIMTGAYFTTTQSSPSGEFGFTNMAGPQIYPVLSYALTRKDALSTYFKYSSVSRGFSISGVGNEIAWGLSYIRRINKENNFVTSIDVAQLKMNVDEILFITSQSVSVSVGIGW